VISQTMQEPLKEGKILTTVAQATKPANKGKKSKNSDGDF